MKSDLDTHICSSSIYYIGLNILKIFCPVCRIALGKEQPKKSLGFHENCQNYR